MVTLFGEHVVRDLRDRDDATIELTACDSISIKGARDLVNLEFSHDSQLEAGNLVILDPVLLLALPLLGALRSKNPAEAIDQMPVDCDFLIFPGWELVEGGPLGRSGEWMS
ncbi:hypothetical protein PG988_010315 [Apiospora saccharicola]